MGLSSLFHSVDKCRLYYISRYELLRFENIEFLDNRCTFGSIEEKMPTLKLTGSAMYVEVLVGIGYHESFGSVLIKEDIQGLKLAGIQQPLCGALCLDSKDPF